MDFFELLKTPLLAKEHICLVENDALQCREVKLFAFIASSSKAVGKFAKRCDNDVSVSLTSC